jgi:hypothetical protein
MLFIYVLICLFVILISYQIYLAIFPDDLIEGLENNNNNNTNVSTQEYKPYNVSDPNNSLILAQQNAGNIEVLKGRMDEMDGIKKKVDNIQLSIDAMQIQMDDLVQQQADYAQEIAGSTPPDITGTDEENVDDVEISIEEDEEQ